MAKKKFADAKVGDRVYDVRFGEGEIVEIGENYIYPIGVDFQEYPNEGYTLDGRYNIRDKNPSLMHVFGMGKEAIKPPHNLKVDTKVLVCINEGDEKVVRHFSHWGDDGRANCFNNGKTSLDADYITIWNHCEPFVEE